MEKIKDPQTMMMLGNTAGLLASSVYFYKQMEAIRFDMAKISENVKDLARKMSELEKNDQSKNEGLNFVAEQIKNINKSIETIDELDTDLTELYDVLAENEIEVDRPSEETYYRKKKPSNRDQESRNRRPQKVSSFRQDRNPVKEKQPQVSLLGDLDEYEDLIQHVRNEKKQQTHI